MPESGRLRFTAPAVRARWLLTVFHVRLPVLPSNLGVVSEIRMSRDKDLSQATKGDDSVTWVGRVK
jgi:hypothetical protein